MIAYEFDINGYYTEEIECQKDPLESIKQGKDIWLLPANCTWEKPLEEKEGYRIKFVDGVWEYEAIPEPPVPPEPTEEEKKDHMRAIRNYYLASTDFTQLPDVPLSEEERQDYCDYRQYLRDYTETEHWWEEEPKSFDDWKRG